MSYRELTEIEKSYLAQGGRVFLVSDQNEVVIFKKGEEPFLKKFNSDDGGIQYRTEELALQHAWITACLSEDKPMVEGVVVGLLVSAPTRTLRT